MTHDPNEKTRVRRSGAHDRFERIREKRASVITAEKKRINTQKKFLMALKMMNERAQKFRVPRGRAAPPQEVAEEAESGPRLGFGFESSFDDRNQA
jgi:hypothetical protein